MQRATSKGGSSSDTSSAMKKPVSNPRLTRLGCVIALLSLFTHAALGCAPTVAIQAPKEPIVINMNIKVEHEIRVNVDQDLEELFEDEEEIF